MSCLFGQKSQWVESFDLGLKEAEKIKAAGPYAPNARGEHGPVEQALCQLKVRVDVSLPAGPPDQI